MESRSEPCDHDCVQQGPNVVQRLIGEAVRSRVVGPDADSKAELIFEADGERLFADNRPIRVIHADASMFVGGLRALLFQSLHPLAMAGVAQHSDYRDDPWGRLQRTADFLAATTFGPVELAERTIERVKAVHQRVSGVASDGRPYSAGDPHLLKWVHIAEVDSFIAAHRRFGSVRLDDRGYDGYVADMAVIAERLGVPDAPRSLHELRECLDRYRPELASSTEARDAARYLLLTPPLPLVARPFYGVIAATAVSLLPAWTRLPLRLPWLPVAEATTVRAAGMGITRTLGWALSANAPAR